VINVNVTQLKQTYITILLNFIHLKTCVLLQFKQSYLGAEIANSFTAETFSPSIISLKLNKTKKSVWVEACLDEVELYGRHNLLHFHNCAGSLKNHIMAQNFNETVELKRRKKWPKQPSGIKMRIVKERN
jgi:hypothetical protein